MLQLSVSSAAPAGRMRARIPRPLPSSPLRFLGPDRAESLVQERADSLQEPEGRDAAGGWGGGRGGGEGVGIGWLSAVGEGGDML